MHTCCGRSSPLYLVECYKLGRSHIWIYVRDRKRGSICCKGGARWFFPQTGVRNASRLAVITALDCFSNAITRPNIDFVATGPPNTDQNHTCEVQYFPCSLSYLKLFSVSQADIHCKYFTCHLTAELAEIVFLPSASWIEVVVAEEAPEALSVRAYVVTKVCYRAWLGI